MTSPLISPDDLTPFAAIDATKAAAMIADAIALASISAPCLVDTTKTLTDTQAAIAKAVLRGAILRWNDSGTGAISAQSAGPYSVTVDTRQPHKALFWPSEITTLQKICLGDDNTGGAFSIDTAAAEPMRSHAVFFGTSDGFETVGAVAFDDDTDSYFGEL